MNKKGFHTLITFLILSSLALLVSGCSAKSASGQEGVPSVKVIKVGLAPDSGLMASGKVTPDQEVQVVSKVPGKVAAVNVTEGTNVKKGDELVKLEADDYILQVKQAEAGIAGSQAKLADAKAGARAQEIEALAGAVQQAAASLEQTKAGIEQAKAAYDLAQKSYERVKRLFESSAISQAELDKASLERERARTGYEQAQAQEAAMKGQLAAAQAKLDLAKSGVTANTIKALQADVNRVQTGLDLAKNALANTSVKAPIDGIVVARNVEPGEMAQPGVPLLTIVKMDQVQVQVSVPQEQINQVKKGTRVDVKVNGLPNKVFQGVIDFVSPVSDSNNTTFPVKVKVKNEEGLLRAGMVAQVYLNGNQTSRIEIPKTALVEKNNKTYVYKWEAGAVRLVEVSTEEKNQDWVYLLGGLKENEQIVINPNDKLADGVQVRAD